MKKVVFILVSFSLLSCATTKSGTSKTIDIVGAGVIHKPVIADLDVNQQKITKTINLKSMESLENSKNEAIRELLKENGADLFIEPKFESVTKNGKTELTISGWLAYYKNFRTIEEKDIKLIEVNPFILNKPDTSQSIILKKEKK
jgi:hypothetical protein